jgi:HNH endonuclease
MHPDTIPVPLRDRTGATIAYAVIDVGDAHLMRHRWHLDSDPRRAWDKLYARRGERRRGQAIATYLHREIMGLGVGDDRVVDHINGITLDNRRANLRILTRAENSQNHQRRRSGSSSHYRGVTWDKSRGKWMARAGGITLGRFDDEDEAGRVASAWRAMLMPHSQEPALDAWDHRN